MQVSRLSIHVSISAFNIKLVTGLLNRLPKRVGVATVTWKVGVATLTQRVGVAIESWKVGVAVVTWKVGVVMLTGK